MIALMTITGAVSGYYFRYEILWLISKSGIWESTPALPHTMTNHDFRNKEILSDHIDKILGIDISHYQEKVHWHRVKYIYEEFPVDFVVLRATMGWNGKDKTFSSNWADLRRTEMVRGAYHFYRPDEPSLEQAQNFIESVKLVPGDLPPVLDIETMPGIQSMDRLKIGLKNWLKIVEDHYGVQPIIYSGQHFYDRYLSDDFSEYVIWIANYNDRVRKPKKHWHIWQFTEKGLVKGIKGNVDINVFNGGREEFERLRIKAVR